MNLFNVEEKLNTEFRSLLESGALDLLQIQSIKKPEVESELNENYKISVRESNKTEVKHILDKFTARSISRYAEFLPDEDDVGVRSGRGIIILRNDNFKKYVSEEFGIQYMLVTKFENIRSVVIFDSVVYGEILLVMGYSELGLFNATIERWGVVYLRKKNLLVKRYEKDFFSFKECV
ncbi:MAG TPA: hypothetical protein DCL21_00305 [Alphaproteobacteria bacterium]|nr:hypothetical protein [Alphaproteobacteria bacterium]